MIEIHNKNELNSLKMELTRNTLQMYRFIIVIILVAVSINSAAQHEGSPRIESLFQVIINVDSMEKQVKFYRDVLGLTVVYPEDSRNIYKEPFVRFQTGGAFLTLHSGRSASKTIPNHRISFKVANLESVRLYLQRKKVTVGEIRNPAPSVYVLDCKDPEGNVFHMESTLRD